MIRYQKQKGSRVMNNGRSCIWDVLVTHSETGEWETVGLCEVPSHDSSYWYFRPKNPMKIGRECARTFKDLKKKVESALILRGYEVWT